MSSLEKLRERIKNFEATISSSDESSNENDTDDEYDRSPTRNIGNIAQQKSLSEKNFDSKEGNVKNNHVCSNASKQFVEAIPQSSSADSNEAMLCDAEADDKETTFMKLQREKYKNSSLKSRFVEAQHLTSRSCRDPNVSTDHSETKRTLNSYCSQPAMPTKADATSASAHTFKTHTSQPSLKTVAYPSALTSDSLTMQTEPCARSFSAAAGCFNQHSSVEQRQLNTTVDETAFTFPGPSRRDMSGGNSSALDAKSSIQGSIAVARNLGGITPGDNPSCPLRGGDRTSVTGDASCPERSMDRMDTFSSVSRLSAATNRRAESGYQSGTNLLHQLSLPDNLAASTSGVKRSHADRQNIFVIKGKEYRVLNQLGKGGSSLVYQVYDEEQKQCLAVKVVCLEDAEDAVVNAYRNEIHLLDRLQNSPRVIRMIDFEYNPDEQKLYVVMEKGDTDLAAFFKTRKTMEKEQRQKMIAFYWGEMLSAVQIIHKEGIVHSDLKPSNFILVAGNLKLIDFGIANAVPANKTSVTRDCQMGTLNYMSPEAAQNAGGTTECKYKIGPKSDVWSLGCILYNMVYGRTPFQHVTDTFGKYMAIINEKYTIEFPDVNDKNLVDVMRACLQRDLKLRPTIEDLLEHPYLKNSKANPLSDEAIQSLWSSISRASPRTGTRVLKNALGKVNSGLA